MPETLNAARSTLTRHLAGTGNATPALDARLLVQIATGLTHEELLAAPDRPLTSEDEKRLQELRERRLRGEPISRLSGEREFFGLLFLIAAATLDPRPETETLVELGLEFAARHSGPRILDLGTGSGVVVISLLSALSRATGTATDIDPEALTVASQNARRHGVGDRLRLLRANWCDGLAGPFHLIVSNPPYIPSGEIDNLSPEVSRFDPRAALDGGLDGLDAYRAIAVGAARIIARHGLLAVEIGAGHELDVTSIFRHAGWQPAPDRAGHRRDLAGRTRVLGFERR